MPFVFSLAAVLHIRELVEEREERLLRQITMEIAQTIEHLESNQRALDVSYGAIGKVATNTSPGYELHAAYGQIKDLAQAAKDLEAHMEKLMPLRNKQLTIYQSAHRDREMLTTMLHKQRNAYNAHLARREQMQVDDNYIARRLRSPGGKSRME